MLKLNQLLAMKKGITTRVKTEVDELHKKSQKFALFLGTIKKFESRVEGGEEFPTEKTKVQIRVEDHINSLSKAYSSLINIEASIDYANLKATTDLLVEGEMIAKNVPATHLLFLKKRVEEVATFIKALPLLDEAEDWERDESTGLHKSESTLTAKTKKMQRAIILSQATDKFPAQTQLITEDVTVGYMRLTKMSGSITSLRKKEILNRCELLLRSINISREAANNTEADSVNIGDTIFQYLLK